MTRRSSRSSPAQACVRDELIARLQRAGATGPRLLRADSGFWSNDTLARLERVGRQFSIGLRMQPHVRAAIEQLDETAWTTLADYPPTGLAQIAETTLGGRRLVVRRVRTLADQAQLLPDWQLFAFITNRTEALADPRPRSIAERRVSLPATRTHAPSHPPRRSHTDHFAPPPTLTPRPQR